MAYSAMTQEGHIVTPYKQLEQQDISFLYRAIREQQRQGTKFFCPHCYRHTGQKAEMRFRGTDPSKARPHFYHLTSDGKDCSHYSKESEGHLIAKAAIGEQLSKESAVDVEPEFYMGATTEVRSRRPDVVAMYPNGSYSAHEIQISPINSTDLELRTNDILTHFRRYMAEIKGVSVDAMQEVAHTPAFVAWYLPKKNLTPENVDWAYRAANVRLYKLTFNKETGIPRWALYDFSELKEQEKQKRIHESALQKIQQQQEERKKRREAYLNSPEYAEAEQQIKQQNAEEKRRQWPVTNSKGWHGRIVKRPPKWSKYKPLALNDGTTQPQNDVVYVQWQERKDHPGGDVLSCREGELRYL